MIWSGVCRRRWSWCSSSCPNPGATDSHNTWTTTGGSPHGERVELVGEIAVPPGAGVVVSTEWDYDGSGTYADVDQSSDAAAAPRISRTHASEEPGTYFVTLRAASQREDTVGYPLGRALNVARVRVVVS